jgi:hypothetical protein
MIRFIDQKPKFVWLSQHADGQAFTYSAMEKDKTGRVSISSVVFLASLTKYKAHYIQCKWNTRDLLNRWHS